MGGGGDLVFSLRGNWDPNTSWRFLTWPWPLVRSADKWWLLRGEGKSMLKKRSLCGFPVPHLPGISLDLRADMPKGPRRKVSKKSQVNTFLSATDPSLFLGVDLRFRGPGRRSPGARSQKVSKKSPGPGVPKV